MLVSVVGGGGAPRIARRRGGQISPERACARGSHNANTSGFLEVSLSHIELRASFHAAPRGFADPSTLRASHPNCPRVR
jgi:hypothetical protein